MRTKLVQKAGSLVFRAQRAKAKMGNALKAATKDGGSPASIEKLKESVVYAKTKVHDKFSDALIDDCRFQVTTDGSGLLKTVGIQVYAVAVLVVLVSSIHVSLSHTSHTLKTNTPPPSPPLSLSKSDYPTAGGASPRKAPCPLDDLFKTDASVLRDGDERRGHTGVR